MSQAGTPSAFDGAPEITGAVVRVRFVPDHESLEAAKQEAERAWLEVVDRIRQKAKEAVAEVLADALDASESVREATSAAERPRAERFAPIDVDDEGRRVAPVADQTLTKLTEIQGKLDDMADTLATIAENTAE